jgi:enoyl-CoA hydratase/carnithine racemase
MDELRLEVAGSVATLLIDRPDRRNAFTQTMWFELPRLVQAAEKLADVRVLVVASSTEGIFSAGADIGEYRDHAGDAEWAIENQGHVAAGTASLRGSALPVIAVIDGPAFGAGAALVASCDVRLATERTSFAITPARLGMVYPFPDTAALVDVVGPAAARRILTTAATFDAAEALRIGFVDEVVEPPELQAARDRHVDAFLANSATSIRIMKAQVAMASEGRKRDDDRSRAMTREAYEGGDFAEGTQAFLERRPPRFT